jgi:hypothetical protein
MLRARIHTLSQTMESLGAVAVMQMISLSESLGGRAIAHVVTFAATDAQGNSVPSPDAKQVL